MRTMLVTVLMAGIALPALAADRCNVPKEKWRPVEELKAELMANGWEIKKIKMDSGCYEVYGKDGSGKRAEIFFDPATFVAVGSDG